MRLQGIDVQHTTASWTGQVGHFAIDSVGHGRFFEGHCGTQVEGRWTIPVADTIAAGSYVVSTNQRMGMLAAFLLEPGSEDGYATWNFFDRALAAGGTAPVRRLATVPASLKLARVP